MRKIIDEEVDKVHNIGFQYASKMALYKNRLKAYKKTNVQQDLSEGQLNEKFLKI